MPEMPPRNGLTAVLWFRFCDWAVRSSCSLCAEGVDLEAVGGHLRHVASKGVFVFCQAARITWGIRTEWEYWRRESE